MLLLAFTTAAAGWLASITSLQTPRALRTRPLVLEYSSANRELQLDEEWDSLNARCLRRLDDMIDQATVEPETVDQATPVTPSQAYEEADGYVSLDASAEVVAAEAQAAAADAQLAEAEAKSEPKAGGAGRRPMLAWRNYIILNVW